MNSADLPVGIPNSFDPLPNPLITGPFKYIGKGDSGDSGPTMDGLRPGRDMEKSEFPRRVR